MVGAPITFYTEYPEAWEAMLRTVEGATRSIDIEQFILREDEIGKRLIALLKRKASEGVRVRMIIDAAGSFALYRLFRTAEWERAGIEVVFFNTLLPGGKYNYTAWLFRDHKKVLIVDGVIGFTGGICLAAEMRSWRDTHVRVEGGVVQEMEYEFDRMWRIAHKRVRNGKVEKPTSKDGLHYISNSPLPKRRFLYYRLIDAIRGARTYVYLTTPYFVPDRRLARVLFLAARRGVDVRLLLPLSSDHPVVDLAGRSYFSSLLRAGVKIYQYGPKMIHAKTVIIDDEWATIGSLNLDYVSLRYNFEGNIVSTLRSFALELRRHFEEDMRACLRLDASVWKRRSIGQKILEYLVIPLRRML